MEQDCEPQQEDTAYEIRHGLLHWALCGRGQVSPAHV